MAKKITTVPAAVVAAPTEKKPARPAKAEGKPAISALRKRARITKPAEPRVSGLGAALTVLQASKQPMKVGDLAEVAIKKGLWSPKGKTPEATLASALYREIKDKGKQSRFKKAGPGLYAASTSKRV